MEFERPPKRHSHIEIAPLVDVVFLLLLFFVLSYNVAGESAIEVVLPPSSEARQDVDDSIAITLGADGSIYLNDAAFTLEDLSAGLHALVADAEQPSVAVRADEKVDLRRLMRVVDAIKQAGCTSFTIVARNP